MRKRPGLRVEIPELEGVEPVRRGIYGSSVLYADFAGIVADSIPESEHQECLNKAQELVRP